MHKKKEAETVLRHGKITSRPITSGKAARRKRIKQYTMDGDYIRTFASLTVAAKEMKLPHTSLSQCSRGLLDQSGGFRWIYEGERFCQPATLRRRHPVKNKRYTGKPKEIGG